VGLRYFTATVDETIAGQLARSAVAHLQAMRTHQYEDGGEIPRAERYAQAAAVECFRTDTEEVVYLFDAAAHDDYGPGALLADQGLGEDIDDWMPSSERVYGVDGRFGCQVFYKKLGRLIDEDAPEAPAYLVFVAVQKTPEGIEESAAWTERFPPPSDVITLSASGSTQIEWPGGFAIRPGASLVDVERGDWADVVEVSGSQVTLNRALAGTRVRAINHCVAVYLGVVSKEAVR